MESGRQHTKLGARPARPARRWPFSPTWQGVPTRGEHGLSAAEYTTAPTTASTTAASEKSTADTLLDCSELPSVDGRVRGGGPGPPRPPQPNDGDAGNTRRGLVHDMMPLVWTLRLMSMLPVTILPNSNFRFRWLSLPMAYSFATWLLLVVDAYFTVRLRLDPVNADGKHFHVWDLVPKYASSFSLCYIVFLPFTSWCVTERAIDMIEDWKNVEVMLTALHGAHDAMHLPRLRFHVWACSLFSFGFPVAMQAIAMFTLPDQALWSVPAQVHSMSYVILGTVFWNVSCRALAHTARHQAATIIDDVKRLGVLGLRRHRRVWVGMVKVLHGLSEAWGPTQMVLMGIFFITFVSISFLLTHIVVANTIDRRVTWLFLAYTLVIVANFTLCSSAQILTDAIRIPTKIQLLLLSFLVKDEATTTEIVNFLEEIHLESPKVSVCRLGVLDRSSVVYLFALANTYIVVLSQFSLSIETSTTDFAPDTDEFATTK